MSVLTVNESTFLSEVGKKRVTLVEFGASWCPPCKVLLPILDELGDQYPDTVGILTVDCDKSPDIAAQYGIMSMPTVILFHNAEPVEKLIGLRSKTVYEALIAKHIVKF
ncbi:thioredoxin family protein [Paenibacillus agricola]|uniref:Thioredoxin n=1 Tax=Paenibacillus agricola TaxID=2716264 RepID=A0ABX0IZZ1_9BACL|nr:thioredoxin domain-containing protein [Paenibacillus agricola]NHN29549.1 conjugal transfer protein TraF [Paenibacillus agricola]